MTAPIGGFQYTQSVNIFF